MNSTALGAENIIFISDAHEKFYYEKLKEVRYQDVYHNNMLMEKNMFTKMEKRCIEIKVTLFDVKV